MGDVAAKTFRVKMALPDDTPLKPGMSVEANIVTREKPNALLIPADALQGNAVFVLDGATCASARSRSASAAPARSRCSPASPTASGSPRRRRPTSRTAPASASSNRGRESHLRYRLDPCARPRAADRLCGRRRRHRGRLLDHDGLADAGLAGRLHPAAGQHAAAHHRHRRAAHAAAAAGRGDVQRRRNPRPDAGSAPARHQESARHHGRAGSLAARRGRALGEGAGDHPLRQPRRRHHRDRHRPAAREQGVRTAQADARRHPQRALPRHQRHRHRRPAGGEDRRPHRRQYHAADQPGRAHQRAGGRLLPHRRAPAATRAPPMC